MLGRQQFIALLSKITNTADDQKWGRQLATLLERNAIKLRLKFGGQTMLGERAELSKPAAPLPIGALVVMGRCKTHGLFKNVQEWACSYCDAGLTRCVFKVGANGKGYPICPAWYTESEWPLHAPYHERDCLGAS